MMHLPLGARQIGSSAPGPRQIATLVPGSRPLPPLLPSPQLHTPFTRVLGGRVAPHGAMFVDGRAAEHRLEVDELRPARR